MIKENQKYLNRLLFALDIMSILLSFVISWYLRFISGLIDWHLGHLGFREHLVPVLIVMPVLLSLYHIFNLYRPYRSKGSFNEFLDILKANLAGMLILVLLLFVIKRTDFSRYLLLIYSMCTVVITAAVRAVIRLVLKSMRRKGYNLKHILIVGKSDLAVELIKRFKRNRHWGYHIAGIFDDFYDDKGEENEDAACTASEAHDQVAVSGLETPIIGGIVDLEEYLSYSFVDEVYIAIPLRQYERLPHIIGVCEKCGIRVRIVPDYIRYLPSKPHIEELDGLPVINLRYIPLDNIFNRFLKRVLDILCVSICIILSSPMMIITALLIKLTSPGPVLFRQERVGYGNRAFMMYKFRSMRVQNKEEQESTWTTRDDQRKTKLGSFIRKTSIDELPQLFNVLKGDMSLVGPRPERPYFVERFREEIPGYMVKHQVRPGMTGWAQVNGLRGDTSIKKRIEYDLYYIENWSLWFDIRIMFLTLFKGLVNRNAY